MSDGKTEIQDHSNPRWWFLLAVFGGALLIDQVTKTVVVQTMAMFESVQPIPAFYPVFQITRSYNTGSAFGMFAGSAWASRLFLVAAFVISGVLVWGYRSLTDDNWDGRIATGLIIGGALGNAIDRLVYGHVVDFIHWQIPGVISNVSNVADHAIVGGVLLMLVASWRPDMRPPEDEKTSQTAEEA